MHDTVSDYYDMLIEEGNDPVLDPPILRDYMDKWDGSLFTELLKASPDKTALEIGCGTGRIAKRVAPLVKSFYGIDISPKTVAVAKKHLTGANVTLICADFLTYPFRQYFDIIYSSLTFMHIQDKNAAIKTVQAWLAPGGRFVLSIDKNCASELHYGAQKIQIYPDTPENIADLLKKNDFHMIEKYETEFAYIFTACR